MKKEKKIYYCNSCGYKTSKWVGKCPECSEWGSFEEELLVSNSKKSIKEIKLIKFDDVELSKNYRYKTKYNEFDRVLGGGLVKGGIALITGHPGIGKSTLLLQLAEEYGKFGEVLYISGEESAQQLKHRGKRLGVVGKNLSILNETEIEIISEYIIKNKPKVVVADSIQTLYSSEQGSIPGTVSQIRESTLKIMEIAKNYEISFFIVGHITKGGQVAGPKLLEHMVDTVLSFEGEEDYMYRMLRSVKNRFGSTNEIGIFNMEETGLKEVKNPSEFFLSQREELNVGSTIVPVQEGTKIFLLEIQALCNATVFGMPKRVSQGFDYNRMQIITAILEKKLSCNFANQDIYLNVPGGINIRETSADLGVTLALISANWNIGIGRREAAIGEIGLRGEIRKVSFVVKRVKELEKLGFKKVYLPFANRRELENIGEKLEKIFIKNIHELVEKVGGENV